MLILLNLLSGVALLVWGSHIVRTGILRVLGADLRRVLSHSTNGRVRAFGAGVAVTSLVQSSNATAVSVTSFAAQMLFTYAFKYVSATAGSAGNQLTPAVSWALGVSLLGESLTPLALIGAVVCAAGVLWGAGIAMRREPPPPAPGEQIEPAA